MPRFSIAETKIWTLLQLFCDWGLLSASVKRKQATTRLLICGFAPLICVLALCDNP